MNNWRGLKVGDKIYWNVNEFDCVKPIKNRATIVEVDENHAIAKEDDPNGLKLWIDDDTCSDFIVEQE